VRRDGTCPSTAASVRPPGAWQLARGTPSRSPCSRSAASRSMPPSSSPTFRRSPPRSARPWTTGSATGRFRNITASVKDSVETRPFEGILAAVERGTLTDWRRLATAIRADPWGPVAQQVLEAVEMSRPYGASELLTSVVDCARRDAADAERGRSRRRYETSSPGPACPGRTSPSGSAPPARGCPPTCRARSRHQPPLRSACDVSLRKRRPRSGNRRARLAVEECLNSVTGYRRRLSGRCAAGSPGGAQLPKTRCSGALADAEAREDRA
jgi:hypothetical protein